MGFSGLEKNRTKNMWDQSGAVLKESSAKAHEKKVPKEYTGSAGGERKKTVPVELRRLEHAYGSISIGVNQKEQLTVLMNRKAGFCEPGLTEAQKGIRMDRACRKPEGEGCCYTDSFHSKEGAFVWEESKKDSPEKIWKQLKTVPEKEGLEIAEGWLGKQARQIPEVKREELFRKIRRNLKEAVQEARRNPEEPEKESMGRPFQKKFSVSGNEDGVEGREDGEQEETGTQSQSVYKTTDTA